LDEYGNQGSFVLRYNEFPLAPVIIGFVLSPIIEVSLRQGLLLTNGSFLQFFQRPISLFLYAIVVLVMVGTYSVNNSLVDIKDN
jgi:putative tricarboxylic transport membrane protein